MVTAVVIEDEHPPRPTALVQTRTPRPIGFKNALLLGHAPLGTAVVNQALSSTGLGPAGFHPHALRAPLASWRGL
jgi:hypothetical protein